MRQFKVVSASVLASFLGGCATGVRPEAKSIKAFKADPPPNCEDLGVVGGGLTGWGLPSEYRNKMRNQAQKRGANYIRIETDETGTAFKCPNLDFLEYGQDTK